jgi:hypothetical protein
MPFVIRLLGAGSANGASTVLYSASSPAIVSNVRLANGGSAATVNVYCRHGALVQISERNKSIAAGDILTIKPELTLAATDTIEASTSAAVDFVVSGVEKV